MPTYEYACTQCGLHIDVFQRIAEDSLTTCGACGGPLRKVFHPAGILFKGSGFYSTDSRSKSKAATPTTGSSETAEKKEKPAGEAKPGSSSGSGGGTSTAKEKSA